MALEVGVKEKRRRAHQAEVEPLVVVVEERAAELGGERRGADVHVQLAQFTHRHDLHSRTRRTGVRVTSRDEGCLQVALLSERACFTSLQFTFSQVRLGNWHCWNWKTLTLALARSARLPRIQHSS